MFQRPRYLGFAVLLSLISLFGVHAQNDAPTRDVSLQQEWIPFSGYAGEVVAAAKGPAMGIRLKILPGSETIDPIKAVLSGSADFGVVSGDLLISAVQKGAPIVAIGVVNDNSPTCFISRVELGVKAPKDFPGKRVGILRGTNTEKIYEIMMRRNDVSRKTITEVDAPFDLQTFIAKKYDIRPAFIYDEPVTLKKDGIEINILKPSDFRVHFIGTVYFTKRSTVRNNRELVTKIVRLLSQGWKEVGAPSGIDQSIAALKAAFPEIDAGREAQSLKLGLPYFLGPEGSNAPLDSTVAAWQNTIGGLEEISVIPSSKIKVSDVWDSSFVDQLYRGDPGRKAKSQ